MTQHQHQLIRETFQHAERISPIFALTFYQRLFHLDPTLRAMFHSDIAEQSRALMQSLRMLVESVDRFEEVVGVVESLGRRHAGYGVRDEHYDTVGAALLWTFGHALGDSFPPDAREAWAQMYECIATTMKRAASFQTVPKGVPPYNVVRERNG